MAEEKTLTDKQGNQLVVELDSKRSDYVVSLVGEDGAKTEAGFVHFFDREGERTMSHTIVPPEFGGRGIGTAAIKGALADTAEAGLTVVPVCPMIEAYLGKHGEEYAAEGGKFRAVEPVDRTRSSAHDAAM